MKKRLNKKNTISIVIPIYNEEDNIESLYKEIRDVFRYTQKAYEIIFINDRSTDNSSKILDRIAHRDKKVVIIHFLRNFGQTAALTAGIAKAKGEIIIPMDGDGQNDPADIPKLVGKLEEGCTVVSGWRKNRKDPFIRVLPSMIANWIIGKSMGLKIHDNGCALKAYRREVIEGVQLYGEMHRFISVYASWSGGKIAEVVVNHRPRKYGKSKYGFSRVFKVILDLLVIKFLYHYFNRPIHFFGKYGLYSMTIGAIFGIWALAIKIFGAVSLSRTPLPLFCALFMIVGVQLILSGVMAELVMRTYYESQNRTPYIIKKIINGK